MALQLDDSFKDSQDSTELSETEDSDLDLLETRNQVGQILDWEESVEPPRAPEHEAPPAPESVEEYRESGERDEERERRLNAQEEYRESGERDEERERRLNAQEE
jgi:hypothetical protein